MHRASCREREPKSCRKTLFWAKSVLLTALLSGAATADWVELDNGDRLTGKVLSLDARHLKIETAYAGTLNLPRERIRRLETESPVRLVLADGTLLSGRLRADEVGAVRLEMGQLATTQPLAVRELAAVNPPLNPDRTQLTARVSAGGSFNSGNSDARTVNLAAEAVARNPVNRVTLDAAVNHAEQGGKRTTSNARVGLKYDHFLSTRTYLYANTRLEHDAVADLDLRTALGVGAGRQLVDTPRRQLAVEGGLSYVNEDFGTAPDQRFPGARLALRYEEGFWQDRVRLFHDSDVLMSLEDVADTLIRTRTGVRVPIAERLSLAASVHVDYDNVPAPGKDKTDTALIFSVDYRL